MSWDFDLIDPTTRKTIVFAEPHQMRGGTYAIGGTSKATLNVTYNYQRVYEFIIPESLGKLLDGKTVKDTIPILCQILAGIPSGQPSQDYWEPCPGNARLAILDLLDLAGRVPETSLWAVS